MKKKYKLLKSLYVVALLILGLLLSGLARGAEDPAVALRNSYRQFLAANRTGGLPIQVLSQDRDGVLEAKTFALLPQSFRSVAEILASPANWCEMVPVVLNVKACTWQENSQGTQVTFYVGRKFFEPPEDAYALKYDFSLEALRNDYLRIALVADEGPFGTSDYLLEVEAIDVSGKTFLSVLTSYRSTTVSRLATRGYLGTLGRDKVGFTVIGGHPGNPEYIQGIRGIIERNAVRYYLALQAYLETQHLPPDERFAATTERWYDLTEMYRRQLHEMDRDDYLDTKRRERIEQLRLQKQTPVIPEKRVSLLGGPLKGAPRTASPGTSSQDRVWDVFRVQGDKLFIRFSCFS